MKNKQKREQGRKQVEVIEEHGKQLVKSNALPEREKSIPYDKQKKIFHSLVAEKTGQIEKLHKRVDFKNLIYHFKGSTKDIDLNGSYVPISE